MDSKSKVERLLSRAQSLADQFNQGSGRNCIDEAIGLARETLELCPPGHSMRADSLTSLSIHLSDRYKQLGDIQDIEEGIVLDRAALELRPPGHPDRGISLSNLGCRLSTRFGRLGAIEDLDEAVALGRDSLVLRPPGHPNRSICLNNLSARLNRRYEKLGVIDDLDEGIALDRGALALHPPGHLYHSVSLNNLANNLHMRYRKLGKMEDLEEATAFHQDALVLRPPGHPGRSRSLVNLACDLYERYNKVGAMEDLDKTIALNQEALALCPPGHPFHSYTLNNLGCYLSSRYNKFRRIEDLDKAIIVAQDVLMLRPPGHPNRSSSLKNLADRLHHRFERSCELQDQEELFRVYAQLVETPHVISSADLFATRAWINMAEELHHSTTLLSYETYLRLLIHHMATLPSLPRHLNLVRSLTTSLAVDAFSASLRNSSPTKAIELLEQGRGVFLHQRFRLRSPVDDVIASGPEGKTLADRFIHLTSLIRTALDSPGGDQHDHVCRLNAELQRVASNIRELPGLSHFLLPPPFSDLRKAAVGGPVIIVNASKYSCDALVVLLDRDPVHVPLQITRDEVRHMTLELQRLTKLAKLMDMGTNIAGVLRELWDKVVSPIVDVLKTIHPFQSRIWWCPTAEFHLLPLHAAGTYRKSQLNFSDLYISSYTSTLTDLIRTRRNNPSSHATQGTRFVGIGQANAKGESDLHSVGTELANIGERVGSHAEFTRMEGPESCISQVIEALEKNEWVHLACHGLPNVEQPFESAFGLYDGRLTIERIIQCELGHPKFAYLSACHTTVGDKECPDEMIHLASAMQFVGFRSVIGTMWAVDDGQTNKITSKFYDNMIDGSGHLDHTRAAFALHKTMREVRGISFDQRILYVHLGA